MAEALRHNLVMEVFALADAQSNKEKEFYEVVSQILKFVEEADKKYKEQKNKK